MARKIRDIYEKAAFQRFLKQWERLIKHIPQLDPHTLRVLRKKARNLRYKLSIFIHAADQRLLRPHIGSNILTQPPGTLWAWRPNPWRAVIPNSGVSRSKNKTEMGSQLQLFHDCPRCEINLRQQRNMRENDLAPFSVLLETFHFDGGFLSLALPFPAKAHDGLRQSHIIAINLVAQTERPTEITARLNIKNGPNTDQQLLKLHGLGPEKTAEFDLAYMNVNENRIEQMWVDLMISDPAMNLITMRDLTFYRYPRAEL